MIDIAHLGWAENKASFPGNDEEFDCVAEHMVNVWSRTLQRFEAIFANGEKKSEEGGDASK